jgi:chitin synthase
MVLNIVRWFLWDRLVELVKGKTASTSAEKPTTIAMVLACYSESYDELVSTMESLDQQEKIEHHNRMFIIVCDGMVKGKGAEKTTDRILVDDILKPDREDFFATAYESWDGAINGLYVSSGYWRGTPFVCLVKKRNLGKRDGLILVRTLLYKYSQRYDTPVSTLGAGFFAWFSEFSESCDFDQFQWLVGVDADTTFNRTCVYEMHKECVKDPKLVGCSGLIQGIIPIIAPS